MLLSRFWFLVLAVAAGVGLSAALLARAAVNRQYVRDVDVQLLRDRAELELMLRLDARERLDAIAPIAAHGDVRTVLASSSRTSGEENRLRSTLAMLNQQLEELRADLLVGVDGSGRVAAHVANDSVSNPAAFLRTSLGAMPLVEAALRGYVRDDLWILNGRVFRMAARPVIHEGRYVGAVVHGMRIDNDLAKRLAERLPGASVAFVLGERLVGGHFPPPPPDSGVPAAEAPHREAVEAGLRARTLTAEAPGDGAPPTRALERGGRAAVGRLTGSGAESGAGYVLARGAPRIGSVFGIFDHIASDDVASIPWPLVGGGVAAAFAIAMCFMWLERDRQLKRLGQAIGLVGEGKSEHMPLEEFRGAYRRVAVAIQTLADKVAERARGGAGPKRVTNLDAILGPTPGQESPAPFFSFANSEPPPPPKAGIPPAPTGGRPAERPPTPPPSPSRPSGRGASPPAPPASGAPTHAAPSPPAGAPPSSSSKLDPNLFDEDDEPATTIASVPEEIAELRSGSHDPDAEQKHFRDVFDEFVRVKQECGEPTAGFTFEKFVKTLERTRDDIVSKHGAKRVRFAVHVKNDKAALRATPLRD